MKRFCHLSFLLLAMASLSACATVTSGTDHTLLVESDPAGATCGLQRNGASIGAVNPTPGAVRISKSRHDIRVNCEKADHEATSRTVTAGFQAMTLGNVLIGGVIGLAADLASGAAITYPDSVKVVLWPRSFPTAAARDAFFEGRLADTRADFATRIQNAEGACGGSTDQSCLQRVRDLRLQEQEEIRRIEERRTTIPIRT
ncbi:MAG: hypothetical protein O9273_11960 [Acetobacteraceae bacterium]|nr:hypothetical protein [Acetobacteraceae bacterium]